MASSQAVGALAGRIASVGRRWLPALILGAVLAVILGAAGIWWLSGGRWVIIETPSMGRAAPVGTMVFTRPTPVTALGTGDIITFTPGSGASYTHRVVEVGADGVHTKGDLNGANDPWLLPASEQVGRGSLLAPGLGVLVKALPLLLGGGLLVWWVTGRFVRPDWRMASRVIGYPLVFAITSAILQPFVKMVILTAWSDQSGPAARVVSTGLLPIRVDAVGGTHAQLLPGQDAVVASTRLNAQGQLEMVASLSPTPGWWVILAVFVALPLAISVGALWLSNRQEAS